MKLLGRGLLSDAESDCSIRKSSEVSLVRQGKKIVIQGTNSRNETVEIGRYSSLEDALSSLISHAKSSRDTTTEQMQEDVISHHSASSSKGKEVEEEEDQDKEEEEEGKGDQEQEEDEEDQEQEEKKEESVSDEFWCTHCIDDASIEYCCFCGCQVNLCPYIYMFIHVCIYL